jgi:copper transport protein
VKFKRRNLWLIVVVLLYSAFAVPSVSAHALLVRSNPLANEVLAQPPVQVELFFSEAVEEKLSTIKVYDTNGGEVDVGDVRVDPSEATRMTVSLRSLSDGVYTVTWKAVSAVDGHQTVGTFPFAVGNVNPNAVLAVQTSTTASLPFSALLAKFFLLASLALLVGQRLFIEFVWKPALKSNLNDVVNPPIWKVLYRVALIGLLASIGIGILSQAGQTTGNELSFPWQPEVGHILIETRLGVIWLARFALAILAIWLAAGNERSLKNWMSFAVNLSLLFTVTLTSHAATEAKPLVPILDDWIHLIGMTFWLGGLIHLFTGIRQLQQLDDQLRTKLTSLLTRQFSANALVVVSLIGITGLYSASLRVGSWSALLTSLYGHVLLVKQVFVGGLLMIAATNLLIISPRLNRERIQGTANTKLLSVFGKILIAELTFAGFLLASVSYLTYVPPAKIAPITSEFTDSKKVDDLLVELDISPGRVGQNEFMVMLYSNGQPVDTARQVLLRFTPTQANIPPSEVQLIGDGGGMFSAKGTYLSLPGQWQVQTVVRRENKFDAFADFDFKLQKPGTSDTSASRIQSGILIMLIGFFLAPLSILVIQNEVTRFLLGFPVSFLLICIGIFCLSRPVTVITENANPVPPDSKSVSAGQALYATNCISCHGVSGKGDGPIGLTLNPRPADLTLHAIPGVHTDAQLYEWISDGFPGSRMPAFRSVLSDTDRWNLVNFIRTLAPK